MAKGIMFGSLTDIYQKSGEVQRKALPSRAVMIYNISDETSLWAVAFRIYNII